MRRFSALLCVAGLATAPASAVAGPSHDPWSTAQTTERFEWSTSKGRLGMTVIGLTPELRKHFGAPDDRGVLVAHVDPGTPAAAAGIAVGDVIVEVHGTKIDAAPDVLSALADLGKGEHVAIELVRDGKSRSLDAKLADAAPAGAAWSKLWMPPFDAHAFAAPFDEPSWFRDWMKPFAPKQDPAPTDAPSFLRRLRELFAPRPADPMCRS